MLLFVVEETSSKISITTLIMATPCSKKMETFSNLTEAILDLIKCRKLPEDKLMINAMKTMTKKMIMQSRPTSGEKSIPTMAEERRAA